MRLTRRIYSGHQPGVKSKSLLVAALCAGFSSASAQTVVTRFTFESGVNPVFAATYSPAHLAEVGSGTAGGTHASASNWDSTTGYQSATAFRASNWSTAGDHFQFTSNTTGFSNIWVTFAIGRTTQTTTQAMLQYSTNNGANFTDLTPFTIQLAPFFGNPYQTFDLSGVAGIGNNSNVIFRVTSTQSPMFFGGQVYIDDFAVSSGGPFYAVPEPSTFALVALGLGGLGVRLRRHRS